MHGLLAVKVKIVAEPLACNMQIAEFERPSVFKTRPGYLHPAAGYVSCEGNKKAHDVRSPKPLFG
jgi:hypothetical protein